MKKFLTLALCAALALALCVPAAAFSDVAEEAWYAEAVDFCRENGLMDGFPDGSFRPDEPVTRAQLVTTLWRWAGEPTVVADRSSDAPASGFYDVDDDVWFAPAVRWAVSAQITEGTGNGCFSPGTTVTREMLATFFHRFAGKAAAEAEAFADQAEIAAWAQAAALWAKADGLMQGVGANRFDPKAGASRAALAQTLMNYTLAHKVTPPARSDYAIGDDCAPVGAAKGGDGAIYVTDGFGKAVWRVTGDGCERLAGAPTLADATGVPTGGYLDGAADKALFRSPWGIAPFLGGWAVSDPENGAVRVLRDGEVFTANGLGCQYPTGLAADGEGRLYIADTAAGEILLVTERGEVTKAAEGLDEPMGLCLHDGALYIAETGARRILKLADGALSVLAGSGDEGSADGPAAEASFVAPEGVAVADDGSVYVADAVGGTVRRIRDGAVTTVLAQLDPMHMTAFPAAPVGLLWDGGTLYVCDRYARVLTAVPVG